MPARATITSLVIFLHAINLLSAEGTPLQLGRDLSSKSEIIVNSALDSIEVKPDKLDDDVLNAISKLLGRDVITSCRCMLILARNGDNSQKYLPQLIEQLKSEMVVKRAYALFAIGNIGKREDVWLIGIVNAHLFDELPAAQAANSALKRLKHGWPRCPPEFYPSPPTVETTVRRENEAEFKK